jgi:predicted DNA-binding ribbon-helix-helix protein
MAKKKSIKKKASKKSPKGEHESAIDKSTPFTLRLKPDVYKKLKSVAERAGVSMNQLVQGFCEATVESVLVGEAVPINKGNYTVRETPGCLAFGTFGNSTYRYNGRDMSEIDMIEEVGYPIPDDPSIEDLGFSADIWFGLDFSGRVFRRY